MAEPAPKKNFVLELKKAMMKKHAAAHPDADSKETKAAVGRAPVMANKPQKKVTGRGR